DVEAELFAQFPSKGFERRFSAIDFASCLHECCRAFFPNQQGSAIRIVDDGRGNSDDGDRKCRHVSRRSGVVGRLCGGGLSFVKGEERLLRSFRKGRHSARLLSRTFSVMSLSGIEK